MILVDTSVWADHLRSGDQHLQQLLDANEVCSHPMIIGELAMGNLRQRAVTIYSLELLPRCAPGSHGEVLHFIDQHKLYGAGIGYIDAHLLVATLLTPGTKLWTRDKKLAHYAAVHSIGYVTKP